MHTSTLLTTILAFLSISTENPTSASMIKVLEKSNALDQPSQSKSNEGEWIRTCRARLKVSRGELWLTRTLKDNGTLKDGDYGGWNLADYNPQIRKKPIDWELGFILPATKPLKPDLRRINLRVRIEADQPLPEFSLLQIQRPFPVEPYGILHSASFMVEAIREAHSPNSADEELPLGDLLAYADGYDRLGWTLGGFSTDKGFARPQLSGEVDIAAFREALTALPELRSQLDGKATRFQTDCDREFDRYADHVRY